MSIFVRLRELKEKDAPLMIEWMQDEEIQRCFKKKMSAATKETIQFCRNNQIPKRIENGMNIHFAIVNQKDEYLGTISLKDVNLEDLTAEYAISTRRCSWGKGVAKKATELILEKAFREYGLHLVYLNVLSDNYNAIRLYEGCGFKFEGELREHIKKEMSI